MSSLYPCSQCAAAIIQKGIANVVVRVGSDGGEGWRESFAESARMFAEAGVNVRTIDSTGKEPKDGNDYVDVARTAGMDVAGFPRPRGWPIGL